MIEAEKAAKERQLILNENAELRELREMIQVLSVSGYFEVYTRLGLYDVLQQAAVSFESKSKSDQCCMNIRYPI